MKITYFVHGTTTDNESGISSGLKDVELSELGVQQSKDLTELTKDQHFDAVYTSDLVRATESAKLTWGSTYPNVVDKRLRECSYGKYNGRPTVEFKANREKEYIDKSFPGGESCKDVENRMASFLEDLKKTDYEHIAIVAHHIPQLALDVLLKGMTWEEAFDNDWRNTKSWQPGWDYELS